MFATFLSVGLVSMIALLGALALVVDAKKMQRWLRPFVAVTIGVLLGEACFHLIPEAAARSDSYFGTLDQVGMGILAFALVDFGLRRYRRPDQVAVCGVVSLLAESLHNAMDGALIAASYMVDLHAGIATTLAVALHEVPHELGNVAVLLHAGYKPARAVALNLLSASAAFLGAAALLAAGLNEHQVNAIAPIAAGGFLYLAIGSLAPELWRSSTVRVRAASGLATVAGVMSMALMHRFA